MEKVSRHEFTPDWVTCPGETLAEWFNDMAIPKSVALRNAGIPPDVLAGLLAGETPVTLELAIKLHQLTFVPTNFWLAMEKNYRAGLAAGLRHTHDDGNPK